MPATPKARTVLSNFKTIDADPPTCLKRIMDTPKTCQKAGCPRVLYFVSAREERGEKVMGGEKIDGDQYLFGMLAPLHILSEFNVWFWRKNNRFENLNSPFQSTALRKSLKRDCEAN